MVRSPNPSYGPESVIQILFTYEPSSVIWNIISHPRMSRRLDLSVERGGQQPCWRAPSPPRRRELSQRGGQRMEGVGGGGRKGVAGGGGLSDLVNHSYRRHCRLLIITVQMRAPRSSPSAPPGGYQSASSPPLPCRGDVALLHPALRPHAQDPRRARSLRRPAPCRTIRSISCAACSAADGSEAAATDVIAFSTTDCASLSIAAERFSRIQY